MKNRNRGSTRCPLFFMLTARNESLDALRGFAILTMILSGSIAFGGVLPAWMYHAQVPPPLHQFNPKIPGITWVDLVFPFFLFSMGAALPLSIQKYIRQNKNFLYIVFIALRRFAGLAFFALFTHHMKAWVIHKEPSVKEHLLSVLSFALLFFQYYSPSSVSKKKTFQLLRAISYIAGLLLLMLLPFREGKGFDFYFSDIIIMVLANMAFFGTMIYYLTRNHPLLRIGILPVVMGIILSAREPETGWAKTFFEWKQIGNISFDWLYKFYFLKYLFIIIPGTFAGEWLLAYSEKTTEKGNRGRFYVTVILLLLLFSNLYALYSRLLFLNLILSGILCVLLLYFVRRQSHSATIQNMIQAGIYLLLVGLCWEAYEGGIKKDPSTFSYYFVTSGLAFFMLVLFTELACFPAVKKIIYYLSVNGKNPMVAYVAGNLLLLPLLSLTGLKPYWDALNANAFQGLMKGILFTGAVSVITWFTVKKGWYWKT
ncbi:MAG: DUF5009 domain-containing protein [Chitinophagaceae bacterium]|nr:DUF5009 domain-containing protein [Chitinophagaceae bacterium]